MFSIFVAWFLPGAFYTQHEIYITFHNLSTFFPIYHNLTEQLSSWSKKTWEICGFKAIILKFIWPSPNSIYNCHKTKGICLITKLRVGSSDLTGRKFKYSLQDVINSVYSSGNDVKSIGHFLTHCLQFLNERRALSSQQRKLHLVITIK